MATTKKTGGGKAARSAAVKRTPMRTPVRTRRERGMPAEHFAELLESVRQAKQIMRGELAPARTFTADEIRAAAPAERRRVAEREAEALDAATIRERMGLSQTRFATLLGISPRTLQGWEQGRREPKGAERTLLRVAATHPEALLDAVR
jgi:putative transcriptional regulator